LNNALSAVHINRVTDPVIVLIGPTAVGKTDLSLDLAERFSCEIISVDSMQVYRFMDVGTAKPTLQERRGIRHHLLDIADPDEQYNAARFVRDALAAVEAITAAGKTPLLTGGTGLYLKALLEGLFALEGVGDESIRARLTEKLREEGREELYDELRSVDPESAARIHINDTQRLLRALEIFRATGKTWTSLLRSQDQPPVRFANILQIGLTCDRRILNERIERRSQAMFAGGLVEEAEKLQEMGYAPTLPSMQAIGYRHVNNYLAGLWDREETLRLLIRDTRRYAKRQMTWFAGNRAIEWFARDDRQQVVHRTAAWLAARQSEKTV